MPKKSKRQQDLDEAERIAVDMRAKMMAWFANSLAICPPTDDPNKIKYMADAYGKIEGFLDEPPRAAPAEGDKRPKPSTAEKTKRALAALMQKQAESDPIPPESETIPTELTDQA